MSSGGMRVYERKLVSGSNLNLDFVASESESDNAMLRKLRSCVDTSISRQGVVVSNKAKKPTFEMYKLPYNLSINISFFSLFITLTSFYSFSNTLEA